jgi:BON domain
LGVEGPPKDGREGFLRPGTIWLDAESALPTAGIKGAHCAKAFELAIKRLSGGKNRIMATGRILTVGALISAILSVVACHHTQPRDDQSIVEEVQVSLYQDATLKTRDISVIAQHGVVVLIGQVSSESEKAAAERLAAAVRGVKQVINQLAVVGAAPVRVPPGPQAPAPDRSKGSVAGSPIT